MSKLNDTAETRNLLNNFLLHLQTAEPTYFLQVWNECVRDTHPEGIVAFTPEDMEDLFKDLTIYDVFELADREFSVDDACFWRAGDTVCSGPIAEGAELPHIPYMVGRILRGALDTEFDDFFELLEQFQKETN